MFTPQVYPIGIPLLYAFILWVNRESLNPRVAAADDAAPEAEGEATAAKPAPVALDDLQRKLEERQKNPDLAPSMFLWKDFGERSTRFLFQCGNFGSVWFALLCICMSFCVGTGSDLAIVRFSLIL